VVPERLRLSRGLWRDPQDIAALAGRAAAYISVCPEGSVVAGLTAAQLHGLWVPRLRDDLVEVIVRPNEPALNRRAYNRRPGLRARRQRLEADEISMVHGLLVTSEARTWLDLADRLHSADLIAAGDSALRGNATPEQLEDLIARARHRRGIVRARAALPMLDGRSRSRPESHLRYAVVSGGLPPPAVNEPIFDTHGQWLAEPDLSYDDVLLALEYSGAYHADVERMRKDITREIDMGARGGWHTVTFGPTEVFTFPDRIAPYVRTLRRERARLFGLSGRLRP
jgi:hypothetical protein